MTLHMIQMQPDMARLVRWATAQRLLSDGADDFGYTLHALLAAAFHDLRPQPFALLREPRRPAVLLAYTAHQAAALREHAASFAPPDVAEAIGLATLAGKAMPERFGIGHRLGFTVRVRPIVRTDRDSDRTRVRERDAFLAAIEGTGPDEGPTRAEVYAAWLRARLERDGAVPERLTLEAVRRTRVHRRNAARTLCRLDGPEAQFSGVLSVRDPDGFAALLGRGVGRHRAFGFGMLLLRPA